MLSWCCLYEGEGMGKRARKKNANRGMWGYATHALSGVEDHSHFPTHSLPLLRLFSSLHGFPKEKTGERRHV